MWSYLGIKLDPINSGFWFKKICYLKIGQKNSPANNVCLLGTLNYSNVLDIDILLVENSKIDAAFLIINKQI